MNTIPISPPRPKYLAALTARLLRHRYPVKVPAPCHPAALLVPDPWVPGTVACPVEGRHFLAAA
jgi:hypothetical protein